MFAFVPPKVGFSVTVLTSLRNLILSICTTEVAGVSDNNPNLSTALQKYVPVNAGTVTLCAGLATFGTKSIAF